MIRTLKNDISLFFQTLKELKLNKFKLFIIFITLIFSNILSFINPLLFGKIINGIMEKSVNSIKLNLFLMCFFFLVSIILNYTNQIMLFKFTSNLEIEMKENIFNSILKIPYSNFIKIDKGKLINTIEDDSTVFSNLISNNLTIITSGLSLIISLLLMLYISPILTLLYILTLPITSVIYIISGNKIKTNEIKSTNTHDFFISFLNESMYGWKVLKLFNAPNKRVSNFKDIINYLYSLEITKFKIQVSSSILVNILSFLVNILNIMLAAYLIFNGKLSLGMFTAFNDYSQTFKNSSLSFTQLNSIIQETSVSIKRFNDILKYKKNSKLNNVSTHNIDVPINTVEIRNLSYSTPDNNELFKNTNLKFKKNNIYIIKGASGSGKTTLFNILGKFIDEYLGEVFINDINLRDINEHSLRNKLNYIMQDNFLFSLSIKDNISLYREIEFNDIVNACKKLKIHDIIMTLPNKYDTILNKNGTDLSGGQKQRICIARSIVSKPDIYLFDEITSAVDKNNVEEILKIIEDLAQNAIVILTSHDDLNFSIPVVEYYLSNKKFKSKLIYNYNDAIY